MKKSTLLVISSSVWFVYVEKPETYTISDDVTLIGGGDVQYNSIGKNIRRFRTEKKMRQENLAERAGLSTNYIGMVERGEKIPSLESFIGIVNALGVSADMIWQMFLTRDMRLNTRCSMIN